MKITFPIVRTVMLSTAFTLLVSAVLATPASAKTMHHSKHLMRGHHMSATNRGHRMSHTATSQGRMKGSTKGIATGTGMANPAISTAPATSGGDKL